MADTKSALVSVSAALKSVDFRQKLATTLPEGVSVDRFTSVTMTAIQQNPDLLNKDRQSLYLAVSRCAQDGLIPDGRQAALVSFGSAVSYMPMIGGLRRIAAKYGIVIASGVIHENDQFDYNLGIDPTMTHKPPKLGQDRGEIVGVWAQAKDANGQLYLEVMTTAEIEKVRSVSRAKEKGPWVTQWGEMARKTVARRLWKALPLYDMDERDASVLAAADSEFEDPAAQNGPQQPEVQEAKPRSTRPSALQSVVDADDEDVIDVVAEQVGGSEASEPESSDVDPDDPF